MQRKFTSRNLHARRSFYKNSRFGRKNSVLGADLYYHKTSIEGSSSDLSIFLIQ